MLLKVNHQSLAFLTIERLSHYISCHIHDWNVLADFVTLGREVSYTWGCSSNFQCTEIFTFVALLYFWSNVLSTTDRIQKLHNVNGQLLHSKFWCWRPMQNVGFNSEQADLTRKSFHGGNATDYELSTLKEMLHSLKYFLKKIGVGTYSRFWRVW